jgi:hypothetical protein
MRRSCRGSELRGQEIWSGVEERKKPFWSRATAGPESRPHFTACQGAGISIHLQRLSFSLIAPREMESGIYCTGSEFLMELRMAAVEVQECGPDHSLE